MILDTKEAREEYEARASIAMPSKLNDLLSMKGHIGAWDLLVPDSIAKMRPIFEQNGIYAIPFAHHMNSEPVIYACFQLNSENEIVFLEIQADSSLNVAGYHPTLDEWIQFESVRGEDYRRNIPVREFQEMLELIEQDERYRKNVQWGEPRAGHPEGTIGGHIAELERTLEFLRPELSDLECAKLRLLVHTHDTFKPEAMERVPITNPRSHASLAAEFVRRFTDDEDLIQMLQYHDELFAIWTKASAKPNSDWHGRLELLVDRIQDWRVFGYFTIIDNCVPGKGIESLEWGLRVVHERRPLEFHYQDVIDRVKKLINYSEKNERR
jgi:hypothetical protein